jgi:pyruvate formate lyase activating enzyme
MSGDEGYVHSHFSGSTVDGPGIRYVIWTSGCNMRCQYCHNPDTWQHGSGQLETVDQVMSKVGHYADFLRAARGGFTVSGGEPLVQAAFTLNLIRRASAMGLHTALDTNGYLGNRLSDQELSEIDLILLDIKASDPELHRRVTGADLQPTLEFARRLDRLNRPVWVRFVAVPGLTDDLENVRGLAEFVAGLSNVSRVQVLAFNQLGRHKWHELGMHYPLDAALPATETQAEAVRAIFRQTGHKVS